jgi:beta-ureidopropionase
VDVSQQRLLPCVQSCTNAVGAVVARRCSSDPNPLATHAHGTQAHLPAEQLAAVQRVLYGSNQGQPVQALELPQQLAELARTQAFDLQAYRFRAAPEQLRTPRVVRIALIQHGIIKPTTAPFGEQRQVRKRAVCQVCQEVCVGGGSGMAWCLLTVLALHASFLPSAAGWHPACLHRPSTTA